MSGSSSSSDYEDITAAVALTAQDDIPLVSGVLPVQLRPALASGIQDPEEPWTGTMVIVISSVGEGERELPLKFIISKDALHVLYPDANDLHSPTHDSSTTSNPLKASPITANQFISRTLRGCLRVGTALPLHRLSPAQLEAFGISDWTNDWPVSISEFPSHPGAARPHISPTPGAVTPFSGSSVLGQELECGLVIAAAYNPILSFLTTSLSQVAAQTTSDRQDQAMVLLWPLPSQEEAEEGPNMARIGPE